jgi:D-psicose/D-tagatose/L-ribulose 3-epimerase
LGKYGAPLREEGRANIVRVLAELAAEAKGLGMTFGLEICNRHETNVTQHARAFIAGQLAANAPR